MKKKKQKIKIDLNEVSKDLLKVEKCRCFQGTNMNTLCDWCYVGWMDHWRSRKLLFSQKAFYQYREIIAK